MYCTKCGKELLEDTAFCPNCGNKIEEQQNIITAEINTLNNPIIEKKAKKKSKLILIISAILFVVIVASVGIVTRFCIMGPDITELTKNTNAQTYFQQEIKDPFAIEALFGNIHRYDTILTIKKFRFAGATVKDGFLEINKLQNNYYVNGIVLTATVDSSDLEKITKYLDTTYGNAQHKLEKEVNAEGIIYNHSYEKTYVYTLDSSDSGSDLKTMLNTGNYFVFDVATRKSGSSYDLHLEWCYTNTPFWATLNWYNSPSASVSKDDSQSDYPNMCYLWELVHSDNY